MNRPRIPLGLESSRATLNVHVCEQLGRELRSGRERADLGVREVAARLLLSPCQLSGLEVADADAFYSAELYLVAARKYAALVGAGSTLLDDVLVRPDADVESSTPDAGALASALPRMRHAGLVVAAIAAMAVSATVGWYVVSRGWPVFDPSGEAAVASAPPSLVHLVSTSLPMPAASVHLSAPTKSSSVAPTQTAPVIAGSDVSEERYGYVRVQRGTWVFVRYRDNSTVERGLGPGQRLVLQGMPIYIAAGAASGAEVVLDGESVDVERFDVDGQLRIGSAFLSAALR